MQTTDHPSKVSTSPDTAVCESCSAIYLHRRWHFGTLPQQPEKLTSWSHVRRTICPVCRQVPGQVALGLVLITGEFVARHHVEILRFLENVAARSAKANPSAQILRLENVDSDWLAVTTTTEQLAQTIGNGLSLAYGGQHTSHASDVNRMAFVTWHCD